MEKIMDGWGYPWIDMSIIVAAMVVFSAVMLRT